MAEFEIFVALTSSIGTEWLVLQNGIPGSGSVKIKWSHPCLQQPEQALCKIEEIVFCGLIFHLPGCSFDFLCQFFIC